MPTQSSFDRLAINAAIEHLISEKAEGWLDAAQVVTQFGLSIPPGRGFTTTITKTTSSDDDSEIIGYAANLGNVSISDKTDKRVEVQKGQAFERIGYFKMIRIQFGNDKGVVKFWHYKSDLIWQGDEEDGPPSQYDLLYDEEGVHTLATPIWEMEPLPFGEWLITELKLRALSIFHFLANQPGKLHWWLYRWRCSNLRVVHSTRHARDTTIMLGG